MALFRRRRRKDAPTRHPARVPEGLRVYAIGDIHGRLDLLEALHEMIVDDLARSSPDRSVGVFLGDYVDRGPASREVVEWLSAGVTAFDEIVCLRGNHEAVLEEFLGDRTVISHVWDFGGFHTIRSYGVEPDLSPAPEAEIDVHRRFLAAFPERHRRFLGSLLSHHTIGDYFFAHAGVRPGVPLDLQSTDDLLWIREPFLGSERDFGKVVIHGHTPCNAPELRANRINIDTGAFFTGVLTGLVLEGAQRRFLQTT